MTINYCSDQQPESMRTKPGARCVKPVDHYLPHANGTAVWDDGKEITDKDDPRVVYVIDDTIDHLEAAADLLTMAMHPDRVQDLRNMVAGLQGKRNAILGKQHDQKHGRLP
jgi:hypothetical protein